MKPRDIYRSGYSFVKEKDEKQIRILKIVSIVLPLFIFLLLIIGFVRSLDFFAPKKQSVNQVFDPLQEERRIAEYDAKLNKYADVKIPYDDPQKRFSVIFMTPYVSNKIGVVIYTEKDYYKIKEEADEIISQAKTKVPIETVNYINRFDQK